MNLPTRRSRLMGIILPVAGILLPLASFGVLVRRGVDRLIAGERRLPNEEALGPALDALGGEVVRLRSRDGTRLAARWLPAAPLPGGAWTAAPEEAILLLHGWTGSIAPDLVELGPFLRRTAAVLGLDFGGHGDSDDAATTFGWREVDDVAGALAWLGERGIRRVVMVGRSMGGITAISAVAVLGDGSLPGADDIPETVGSPDPPRPAVVGVVADSVTPELETPIASRLRSPFRRLAARRILAGLGARLGADPRQIEPVRVVGLVEPVPLLLVAGTDDRTVPLVAADRLAAAAGPSGERLVIPGADHGMGHRTDPVRYEAVVTAFLERAFSVGRPPVGILGDRDEIR